MDIGASLRGADRRWIACVLIVAILPVAVYGRSVFFPFHWDDEEYVTGNPILGDYRYVFAPSTLESPLLPGNVQASIRTRTLGYLSLDLNRATGGLNPGPFHALNLLLHIANALLVVGLVRLVLRTPRLASSAYARQAPLIACLAGLVFGLHPLNSQAVLYISQRFTTLAASLMLGSLWLYLRHRLSGSGAAYALALVLLAMAMKTKEIAFAFPLVMALAEGLFFEGAWAERAKRLVPFFICMGIVPLELHLTQAFIDITRTAAELTRTEYASTQVSVLVTYLRLFFLPLNQNLDYDYPVSESPALVPLFLLLGLAAWGLAMAHRGRPGDILQAFGIGWFFIALGVESSFVVLSDMIFEHRMYMPSIGLIIACAGFVTAGVKRARYVVIGVSAIAVIFGVLAYERGGVWKDERTLWEDAARKSPLKVRAQYNYARLLQLDGELGRAEEVLRLIIRLDPGHADALNNLGVVLAMEGRGDEAERMFGRAGGIKPGYTQGTYNYAKLLETQGRLDEAAANYRLAISGSPDSVDAYNALGRLHESRGEWMEAERVYEEELDAALRAIDPYLNLASLYGRRGLFREALDISLLGIERSGGHPLAYNNAGLAYEGLGNSAEAVRFFDKAVAADGGEVSIRFNRAISLIRLGRIVEATQDYEEVVRRDPALGEQLMEEIRAGRQ